MNNDKKSNNSFFTFTFFYKKIYILSENIPVKTYIVTFALPFFHVEGYWKCSNTNAHIDIHWFCRRHTLIAMNYFFYLYISEKYLQFKEKSTLIWAINFIIKIIRKGIEILAKHLFSFSIIVFNMKLLFILFIRKKKAFAMEYFWFTSYK